MPRVGTVIETSGEFAMIASSKRGICDGCADRASCSLAPETPVRLTDEIRARNPIDAQRGDRVEFDLEGHAELGVSLLVWIVPLVGLIAGAVLGANVHHLSSLERDIATLFGAVVGAVLAYGVVVLVDRRAKDDARLVPVILKVLPPGACRESADSGNPAAPR